MSITVNVGCKIPNGLQTQFVILNGSKPHSGIEAGYTSIDIETWLEMKRHYNNFIANGSIFADPKEESQAINSLHNQSIAEFISLGITGVKSGLIAEHFGKGLKKKYAEEWLASEIVPVHIPAAKSSNEKLANSGENQNPLNIWQRPIGAIWVVVTSGIVLAFALYYIKSQLGIPL